MSCGLQVNRDYLSFLRAKIALAGPEWEYLSLQRLVRALRRLYFYSPTHTPSFNAQLGWLTVGVIACFNEPEFRSGTRELLSNVNFTKVLFQSDSCLIISALERGAFPAFYTLGGFLLLRV